MEPHSKALIAPKVVALVGVSDNPAKLTARPFQFSRKHGFGGKIYIVNPRREMVLGETAYPSVSAIPDRVDHAYILLGTNLVEGALDDCIAAGVAVVTVLADGFAEAGAEGQARQARLVAKANEAGIMLIGPNSMGVVNSETGFACTTNAAFKADHLLPGRVAVLSHSGSLIGTLLSRGTQRNIGFSHFVSLGNEAQSCVGRTGLALVDSPEIDGFVLFRKPCETQSSSQALPERHDSVASQSWPICLVNHERAGAVGLAYWCFDWRGRSAARVLQHNHIAEVSQLDALFEAPALLLQRGVWRIGRQQQLSSRQPEVVGQ